MRYMTRHYDYHDLTDTERRKARRRVRAYRRAVPHLSIEKARKTAFDAAFLEAGDGTSCERKSGQTADQSE